MSKKLIIDSVGGFPPITIEVENFNESKNKYNVRGFSGDLISINKIMDSIKSKNGIDLSSMLIGGYSNLDNIGKLTLSDLSETMDDTSDNYISDNETSDNEV